MYSSKLAVSLLVFVINFLVVWSYYAPKEPLADTSYGQVRGSIEASRGGRAYASFRGIPFAKPPIGDLRFKAPQPPDPWDFPLDARQDAPHCIQKNYFFTNPTVEGQEDCLYLNIYVPLSFVPPPDSLPVMVFIHWGGFFAGEGSSNAYLGPEYFMDKDVILVTFNYRLGAFGFLSTLDDVAPGNYALKDQVQALRFVQENIRNFGGDPNRVTIFGQSAGSGSVSLHVVSPLSRGLFQQAISQSGVSLNLWARPFNPIQLTVTGAQAQFVGCGEFIGNSTAIIDCLRNVDATAIANSADYFKTFFLEPITPYSTVVETQSEANPEPFLLKDPLEYLQQGDFTKVPYIIGCTQDEGILRASALLSRRDIREALNANFTTVLPQLLLLQVSTGDVPGLYNNIRDFYLGGKDLVDIQNPESVQGFINIYSDRAFIYGISQAVRLQSFHSTSPIWMYNFNYRGNYSYGATFSATNETIDFNWGVSHCDDLLYLFNSPKLFPPIVDDIDYCVSQDLLTLWTNFAIHGHPDYLQQIGWNPLQFNTPEEITSENFVYLNITGSISSKQVNYAIEKEFYTDRIQFWANQSLFENFPPPK